MSVLLLYVIIVSIDKRLSSTLQSNAALRLFSKHGYRASDISALPFGRPALSTDANQACSLGPSGNDQGRSEIEREFLEVALCPALRAP